MDLDLNLEEINILDNSQLEPNNEIITPSESFDNTESFDNSESFDNTESVDNNNINQTGGSKEDKLELESTMVD